MKNIKYGKVFVYILITFAVMTVLTAVGLQKKGYCEDEMFTMGLANCQFDGSIDPYIVDGERYTGERLLREYVSVDPGFRFSASNVIVNQSVDVHPPLYYFLVHGVYSFIPGSYSMIPAFLINVILAAVVFLQMIWLFNYFVKDEKLAVVFSLLCIFTMGVVNNVVFIRMYVLLTVWCNALLMLLLRYGPENKSWIFYPALFIIIVCGTLTQYFFMIYAAFACGVYGILVLVNKKWGKALLYGATGLLALQTAYLMFPAMKPHLFESHRGADTFEKFGQGLQIAEVKSFFRIMNKDVFSGYALWLIALAVIFAAVAVTNGVICNKKKISGYLVAALPVVGFVFLVAMVSPYIISRYIMCVMPVAYLCVFAPLAVLSKGFSRYSKHIKIGVIVVAVAVLISGYKNGIHFLAKGNQNNIDNIAKLGYDTPCLYIYESQKYELTPNYMELEHHNDITFIGKKRLEKLEEEKYHNYDKLILYVQRNYDAEEMVNMILEMNDNLTQADYIGYSGYSNYYYLY